MNTTTNTNIGTRYVITGDGIRMSYEEYIEMRRSELN
jgi:hypothetical protein